MNIDKIYEKIYAALERYDYEAAGKYIGELAPYDKIEAARLRVSLHIEQGNAAAALMAWQELAALLPEDFYTRFLHARILFGEKRYVSAYGELQGITVPPAKLQGYGERIANLRGQCCKLLGKTQEASEAYREAAELADEPVLKALEYSNYLFNLHYSGSHSAAFLRQAAAGFNAVMGQLAPLGKRNMSGRCPLRIGYLSPDFRRHVMLGFSYALLTAFDRTEFSVYAYMLGPEDDYSCLLQGQVTVWRNLRGMPPQEAARVIADDSVDILVDLAGHTKGNGLPILAYKPAPVQVSGIGYFASTGLDTVDYFLGDRYLDGEDGSDGQPEFTEELIVLPHSHFCYSPLETVPLPEKTAFRRNGYVTFGSFNNFAKVTDEVLALWGKILDRVPGSHLLLKAAVFDGGEVEEHTRKRLRKAGLPMERVECRSLSEGYLAEYGDMDIALDTFPYPGGGTSCDALYMGRPLLTLKGGTHGERFGYSLLMNLGLGELVAESKDDYIERAVLLAQKPELLADLQTNIRSMMEKSPLMDETLYLAEMECAYKAIVEKHVSKLPEFPQLTYREQMEEEKYAMAVIVALDRGNLTQAQSGLKKLRRQNAQYYYLQSEILALQTDFAASDISCKQALALLQLAEDWLQGAIYHRLADNAKQLGKRGMAADYYRLSSQHKTMEQGKAVDYSNYLFNLNYVDTPAEKMLVAAQGYGKLFAQQVRQYDHSQHPAHDKLRIGYISPDFCRHVVAAFSQAFFRSFDQGKYIVYAYANCESDGVTRQFMKYPVKWRQVYGLPPAEVAELIYHDEVDILVDLAGHTGHNALPVLAYKPAPVQICGVGYFATTGLETVDYFLADKYTALSMEDDYFTERMLRLPQSHFCYTPLAECQPVRQNRDYITLGTMNQFDKVTDEMLKIWGQIMQQLPDARLLLKSGAFDKQWRLQEAQQRVQQVGISLDRVVFEGYTEDYWQFYEKIDIALDTYPYTGGGSTCDALYMGVPVVSLYGEHHHQRFGYSLLQNTGLGDLAVATPKAYVQCVVKLAADRGYLRNLQRQLADAFRQGSVMDEEGYMQAVEALYQEIWRERQ